MGITQADVRKFLGKRYMSQLDALGIDHDNLPDDLDLLERSIIDSLGLIELVVAIDEEFGLLVDFEEMDPGELTVVGPFCSFVAEASDRK